MLVAVHDSVEVPWVPRVMLAGLSEQVNPVEGVTERMTVPWKPLGVATVIVEIAEDPAAAIAGLGLADTVKSGMIVVTKADRT